MFNIGGWEFLVILVVALVFLGPERLPGAAKQAGKTLGTLREMAQSFQTELEQAVNDPIEAASRATGDKAVTESRQAKQAAATAAHVAESEPDRTEKPVSGTVGPTDAADKPADAAEKPADAAEKPAEGSPEEEPVPDPADLEFESAAPRYPQAESDPVDDAPVDDSTDEDSGDIGVAAALRPDDGEPEAALIESSVPSSD